MIIDFRGRPPSKEFLTYFDPEMITELAKRRAGTVSKAFLNASVDEFIEEMDEAGVDYAVALGRNSPKLDAGTIKFPAGVIANQHLVDLQTQYPNRIIGMAGIDVANTIHDAIAEIETYVEGRGLKGIFIEPQRAFLGHPDDHRNFPVYEKCLELDVPVVIMTGPLAGPDIGFADPAPIDRVATRFPDLKIVCGHGCWPRAHEMVAVALKHPNVYVSPDSYQLHPGSGVYVEAANDFMIDQYLFGTAYPVRPLKQTVEAFERLPFTAAAREKAMGGNAQQLLGL